MFTKILLFSSDLGSVVAEVGRKEVSMKALVDSSVLVLFFLQIVLWFAVYFYSISLVLRLTRPLYALITVLLPIVSQIYWFVRIGEVGEGILDPYCLLCLAFSCVFVVSIPISLLSRLYSKLDRNV